MFQYEREEEKSSTRFRRSPRRALDQEQKNVDMIIYIDAVHDMPPCIILSTATDMTLVVFRLQQAILPHILFPHVRPNLHLSYAKHSGPSFNG